MSGFSLHEALAALRRRTMPMAIVFSAALAAALLTAVLWPPTYRSTGTILIEQQEIPTDFVRSAVSSYADQRVQMISQRVMTSTNLLAISDKYKLYAEDRDSMPREALTERMRHDIQLRMISAEVMDPRQGRATKATIAFSVSYDSRSPVLAARVANELTSLYLSENIQSRKQLAASTADFLRDESERLARSVAALEEKVAAFKQKNGERLPEFAQFNLQSEERGRDELRELDARVRSLDQQIVFLDSQLAQIDPTSALYAENGERILSSRDRLKVLQSQLASARALYNENHPDVQRLDLEVRGLEAQLGDAGTESGKVSSSRRDEDADNPAYIQIRAQKLAALNERASLRAQAAQVHARVEEIGRLRAAAPGVEGEYSALVRDLQNEQAKYAETRQKQMEAQLVQNLETERKGERFTLIEPPLQPVQPIEPNRGLVALLGLVLASGLALGLMYLLEQMDTRIRGRTHLVRLLGVAPLAVVPLMYLPEEQRARSSLRVRFIAAGVVACGLMLLTAHLFWRPLDILWLALARRLGG